MSATADRWRTKTDLGVTTRYYGPASSRDEHAAITALDGLRFGYPPCCVEAFVRDLKDGRHPALRRGSLPTESGGRYVPCEACCEEIGRVFIP